MTLKPELKDDPVWSILPSYDMYQKLFTAQQEPPQYGDETTGSNYSPSNLLRELDLNSTRSSSVPGSSMFARDSELLSSTTAASSDQDLIVADESTSTWQTTILDNIHNLRNFSSSDNPYTQGVDVSIHYTEDVGRIGVPPKFIDPLHFEYKQGDYLNGYVEIKNNLAVTLPFDMFYVVFEGTFAVNAEGNKPKRIKKFLEMYDFAASWNHVSINRLLSETNDDQHCCDMVRDPVDGAYTGIKGRLLQPGRTYKRFFTFRIPERLLDSECNDHNLPSHTLLPPSMGVSDSERRNLLQLKKPQPANDFPFVGTSTSYLVLARFIGKASTFHVSDIPNVQTLLTNTKGDEFIIFKENKSFVRIIQDSNLLTDSEKARANVVSKLLYDNLLSRIDEKLVEGRRLLQSSTGTQNDDCHELAPSTTVDLHKARQLYIKLDGLSKKDMASIEKPAEYKISVPVVKKRVLGADKCLGLILVTSPKTEYVLNYMSPARFQNGKNNNNLWKLQVPIEITYQPTDAAAKAPEITMLVSELAVVTMRSGKEPIPLEFTYDHLFKNTSTKIKDFKLTDNFETIVKGPMLAKSKELIETARKVGVSRLQLERSLLRDVCALASIDVKTNNLLLRGSKIIDSAGKEHEAEKFASMSLGSKSEGYSKKLTLVMDATKAQKKGGDLRQILTDYNSFDEFCLVPSFQHCKLARMYYLRLFIGFSTLDVIELKLPVTIAKIPNN